MGISSGSESSTNSVPLTPSDSTGSQKPPGVVSRLRGIALAAMTAVGAAGCGNMAPSANEGTHVVSSASADAGTQKDGEAFVGTQAAQNIEHEDVFEGEQPEQMIHETEETTAMAAETIVETPDEPQIQAVQQNEEEQAAENVEFGTLILHPGLTPEVEEAELIGIPKGTTASAFITIDRSEGFDGGVEFEVSGLPEGVTATVQPATSTTPWVSITFTVAADAPSGKYDITVTGTSVEKHVRGSVTLPLEVQDKEPAFGTLHLSNSMGTPDDVTPEGEGLGISLDSRGGPVSGSTFITIDRSEGFDGSVEFEVSGLPAGVTATAQPAAPANPWVSITFTVAPDAPPGKYDITVTGTSVEKHVRGNVTFPLEITSR